MRWGGGGGWLTSADYDVLLVRGQSWCFVLSVFCAWPGHTYFLVSCGVASVFAFLCSSVRQIDSGCRVSCVGRVWFL